MKLVYLFNGRLPTEKAHGLQIAKSCESFAQSGFEVELVVPYRANKISEDLFEYYGLKINFKVKKIWGIDLAASSKILYAIQTGVSAFMILLYVAFKYRAKDNIFYARDYSSLFILSIFGYKPIAEFHDYRFKKRKGFVQTILNHSRKIIVNSKGTLELLKQHYKFNQSKVLVISNGVDLDFFNINETPAEARTVLNMPSGTILGYTGRLETAGMDKGVGFLIEAINMMEHKEVVLYVVGGPDSQVEPLKEKAKKLGLENRVIFTGQVAHSLIPKYLRAMDVVVIPLASGQHAITTSPIKLFEYMAAGKVIIASNLPSLKDILDSTEAIFFKPGDALDLATKIDKIISNPELAAELTNKSLKKVQQYSWLNRARTIKNFIVSHEH